MKRRLHAHVVQDVFRTWCGDDSLSVQPQTEEVRGRPESIPAIFREKEFQGARVVSCRKTQDVDTIFSLNKGTHTRRASQAGQSTEQSGFDMSHHMVSFDVNSVQPPSQQSSARLHSRRAAPPRVQNNGRASCRRPRLASSSTPYRRTAIGDSATLSSTRTSHEP